MRVVWTAQALRELESIGDYIARDNRRAAVTVVTRILDLVDLLGGQPEIGRPGRIAWNARTGGGEYAVCRAISRWRKPHRSFVGVPWREEVARELRLIGLRFKGRRIHCGGQIRSVP